MVVFTSKKKFEGQMISGNVINTLLFICHCTFQYGLPRRRSLSNLAEMSPYCLFVIVHSNMVVFTSKKKFEGQMISGNVINTLLFICHCTFQYGLPRRRSLSND